MTTTKVPVELSSTPGIVDNSDATAITIDSSENVGIGTTSPDRALHIAGNPGMMLLEDTGGATNDKRAQLQVDSSVFEINSRNDDNSSRVDNIFTAELGNGNIGIGTVPSGNLTAGYSLRLNGGSQTFIAFNNSTHTTQVTGGFTIGNDSTAARITQRENQPIIISTNDTERMRIDSSGNLLVGATTTTSLSDGTGNDGVQLNPSGTIAAARTSNVTAVFNRLSSDGEIARFNKDGSTVGSLGVTGSGVEFFIDGAINVNRSGLEFSYQAISPRLGQADADSTVDLGRSSRRWKNLYLSSGIYLGGTGSANQLSDYEEGTFTPDLSFGGVASGISWNTQAGRYTKIGRLVLVSVYLYTTGGRGSQTGIATVNVPFLSAVGHPDTWVPISNRSGISAGSNKTLTVYLPATNFSSVRFYAGDNSGGANAQLTHTSFSASSTFEVSFTISYMTSQ